MDFRIDGHAALVTAGSDGLGLASAAALAREGCDVAVCGRTQEKLDDAKERLEAAGDGDVLTVRADITDREAVEAFVDETVDAFGRLDHVVTSAGGPPSGPFLETTEHEWYTAYDLLVMSVVWTTKAAHPHLMENGGTIVNITSASVKEVIDGLVLSNSVRRAVIGLMKTQAREFGPEIRVNAVLPAAHETARIQELVEQAVDRGEFDSYEEGLEAWGEDIPLERIGDPTELGEAVAWLSSDRASYVNGVALPLDGGSMRS
ncbi:SDR family oxidoreductase [Natronomonas sp. EA1]|uniref:SDR family oxidoreductase n=1 Tax=Natronomonas sp. EA1 TaxID=3421655 RepID=UPI003EB6B67C